MDHELVSTQLSYFSIRSEGIEADEKIVLAYPA
jgi:hypothetical protein